MAKPRDLSRLLQCVFFFLFLNDSVSGFHVGKVLPQRKSFPSELNSSVRSEGNDVNKKNMMSDDDRRGFLLLTASSSIGVLGAAVAKTRSSSGGVSFLTDSKITEKNGGGKNNAIFAGGEPYIVKSMDKVLQIIDSSCDRSFLHAVVSSDYKFLYRGSTNNNNEEEKEFPSIHSQEPFDLLQEDTYGSKEALAFFQNVEETLKDEKVKPSNGHLAVTSSKTALEWGDTAVSIWPLVVNTEKNDKKIDDRDNGVHFAWFQDKKLFYPRSAASISRGEMIIDGVDCGKENLEDALRVENCEILFSANTFLAVPAKFDQDLRNALKSSFIM
eukprot:CAMPEP_0178957704 /NCGR_PEP_ID=MMETSP0789-20121207/11095_1 /TAXON_ID=3005 /ORGANISM="Rhizosolenia setigera, Strain CCMP 1694" /LENGTH=327 /DNA_ID=CAMNT_0020640049 /DNA_START=20 /DNA_END=1003 /DNA_ORIENTATION=+